MREFERGIERGIERENERENEREGGRGRERLQPDMDPSNTELVRVRIINGASLTSYKVFLPGNSTIIKADG